MEHAFTPKIMAILVDDFGELAQDVYDKSQMIQYLNTKTKSAGSGSKSRGSFANHYALYVLLEDYIDGGFAESGTYHAYTGARFSDLLSRMRQLPFGSKLQNHALNGRLNDEFAKYFPTSDYRPILRDLSTTHYWIHEKLITVLSPDGTPLNLARSLLKIIDAYVEAKRDAFDTFFEACQTIQSVQLDRPEEVRTFIKSLLAPTVDARLFEIVSFSILKAYYGALSIYWGWKLEDVREEAVILYKTGRTNANDGGIDFVMRPLGRFFQVTETLDVKKYFLDIDKVQKYPLTFVVKSQEDSSVIAEKIKIQAERQYPVTAIVEQYIACIEEIINISVLTERFDDAVGRGALTNIMDEIILQSKVEFNYGDDDDLSDDVLEEEAATYVTESQGALFDERPSSRGKGGRAKKIKLKSRL